VWVNERQPKEGVMQAPLTPVMLAMTSHVTSHWLAVDVAVRATGANPGAQSSKRTRIRAGGLLTAGGRLPE
jgi:hypothetical protein